MQISNLPGGGGGNANGFGFFMQNPASTSTSTGAGDVNTGTNTVASITALRFDALTKTQAIDVQNTLLAHAGPGCSIIFRNAADPTKIAVFRATGPATTPLATTDTLIPVTPESDNITTFASENYEVSVIPAKSISVISGSATITPALFQGFHTWPQGTSWHNWAWSTSDYGTTSPTTGAVYDSTGILMPADGSILSARFQLAAQNGTSLNCKPYITKVANTNGSTSVTLTEMGNTSFSGFPQADANLEEFVMTPTGLNASQLTNPSFSAGDKVIISIQELLNTGSVTSVTVEWALKVAFS